jgi:hypothetical protein
MVKWQWGGRKKIEREEKEGTEIERKVEVKISEFTLNTYICSTTMVGFIKSQLL